MKLIEAKLRLQKQELARMPSSNLIVTVFILNVTENGFTPAPTVRFGKKLSSFEFRKQTCCKINIVINLIFRLSWTL